MRLLDNLLRIRDNLFPIPPERFDEPAYKSGYLDSFVYLLGCLAISSVWMIVISAIMIQDFADITLSDVWQLAVPQFMLSLLGAIFLSYFLPLCNHLALKLLGGKAKLARTIETSIYSNTLSNICSPLIILYLIPFLGSVVQSFTMLGVMWNTDASEIVLVAVASVSILISVINEINGYSRVHSVSVRCAVAAAIGPVLILMAGLVVLYLVIYSLAIMAIQSAYQGSGGSGFWGH